MGIKIEAAAYSSIGGRENNEDNFYLNGIFLERDKVDRGGKVTVKDSHPLQIYGVFDGMGGIDFGEDASFFSVSSLKKYQSACDQTDDEQNLRQFFTQTSKGVDQISLDRGEPSGSCGSTAAILFIGDSWYRTAHVGDSRIYLLRGGTLERITEDQSWVQCLVNEGRITPEEAWSHPDKNIITHHLGMPLEGDELESIISERMPLQEGDCFLLCTDGVSDSMRDEDIRGAFSAADSAADNAARIVRQARQSADEMGEEADNITVVVLRVLKAGARKSGFLRWR